MFCPKCGSQNADETKFCRGCGADLGSVLAIVPIRAVAEKHIELFSSGLRGVLIGSGFVFISAMAFVLSIRGLTFTLFALAFAFFFLGTGISRLVHARALKALNDPDSNKKNPELGPGNADYIKKPSRSFYETDDLVLQPSSITERTTTHLEMDTDGEMLTLPPSRKV